MLSRNKRIIKVRILLSRLQARMQRVLKSGRQFYGRRPCLVLRCVISIALLLFLFSTLFIFQLFNNSTEQFDNAFSKIPSIPSHNVSDSPGVTIWAPRTSRPCTGRWNSPSPEGIGIGPEPYIMIRDVLLDRRHASRAEFRSMYNREHGLSSFFTRKEPPFLRIIIYASVHLSVKLNSPGATSNAGTQLGPSVRLLLDQMDSHSTVHREFLHFEVEPHVDHVIHSTFFRVHNGPYKPGTKTARTKDGMRISEWQIVLSLRPRDGTNGIDAQEWEEKVRVAAQWGAKLSLTIPLLRYNGEVLLFEPTMNLECITGWEHPDALPAVLSRVHRPENCKRARGAAAMVGSPLHGKKKKTMLTDIAHFAARSLLGPLRFETVVVTVVPERSLFEIYEVCRHNNTCIAELEAENTNLLKTIAKVTEDELEMLGVPRALFPNIIIVPFCRLGSNYDGKERDSPCAASFWSGQHQNNFFGYTLISPYFKWVAVLDLDEFLAPNVHNLGIIRPTPQHTASAAFDKYAFWTTGALRMSWLNFHFRTLNESRALTKDVILSSRIPLFDKSQSQWETFCYRRRKITNGKIAVSCNLGLGFTIHSAVRWKRGGKLSDVDIRTRLTTTAVRTWHSRWDSAMSPCVYDIEGSRTTPARHSIILFFQDLLSKLTANVL